MTGLLQTRILDSPFVEDIIPIEGGILPHSGVGVAEDGNQQIQQNHSRHSVEQEGQQQHEIGSQIVRMTRAKRNFE